MVHSEVYLNKKVVSIAPFSTPAFTPIPYSDKKLSYRRVTARCVLSVVILPIATQQCRNYLNDKS